MFGVVKYQDERDGDPICSFFVMGFHQKKLLAFLA